MINHFLLFTLLASFFYLSGCDDTGNLCDVVSVNRQQSSGNKVEALLIKKNCGATASYIFEVYISPVGSEPLKNDMIFKSDKTSGLSTLWESEKNLLINYNEARIFKFKSFWSSDKVNNHQYNIKITEIQK